MLNLWYQIISFPISLMTFYRVSPLLMQINRIKNLSTSQVSWDDTQKVAKQFLFIPCYNLWGFEGTSWFQLTVSIVLIATLGMYCKYIMISSMLQSHRYVSVPVMKYYSLCFSTGISHAEFVTTFHSLK